VLLPAQVMRDESDARLLGRGRAHGGDRCRVRGYASVGMHALVLIISNAAPSDHDHHEILMMASLATRLVLNDVPVLDQACSRGCAR
jgi:hypothetical protein